MVLMFCLGGEYDDAPVVVQQAGLTPADLPPQQGAPDVRQFVCQDLGQKGHYAWRHLLLPQKLGDSAAFLHLPCNYPEHQFQENELSSHDDAVVVNLVVLAEVAGWSVEGS